MRQPPTGTVTFLFTDIEGSTRLWERHPDAMRHALARHDSLLRRTVQQSGGYIVKTTGDGVHAAFANAPEALAAVLSAQLALLTEPWEAGTPLRVRMGLHSGAAEWRDGDYYGGALNRAARLMAAGHGGQVLLSDATQEAVRGHLPDGAGLRDLGERRLKDLARPERVFQLLHPDLPADFPPLKSLDNPELPNNLPQQPTSFVGREKEIDQVKRLLEGTRLLTLAGSGGAGKSRLSLQVAADLLDRYFDGVWLVELAPVADPTLVPQAVADALGVREETDRPILTALTDALKPKRLLLILDNCEHLVAACATLASELLRSCPQVRILASSREPLNVGGEQTYRIPSLSLPDLERAQTVEDVAKFEAVRLFTERAQAVRTDFGLTDANAPAVAQVCRRLDGIPLAIELAAARVRVLSVEEINTRLEDRFKLLTGGSRTLMPRQQTLRALIDWSYDLLTDQERALLGRLSVFAGGWTLGAAEAVCAGDGVEDFEVLDLLTALADKSLAVAETAGKGIRYRLLETVRQYGLGRLAEGTAEAATRERHATFFLTLSEEAEPLLRGPEQAEWLARLETEHENLRAALAWCEQQPGEVETGLRLGGALWRFWAMRSHLGEGRAWLGRALARPGGEEAARIRTLRGAGILAFQQGDLAAARTMHEESLRLSRRLGDQSGVAHALNDLGSLAADSGDYGAARTLYEESLALHRRLGDRRSVAIALNDLGNLAADQGEFSLSRAMHEQCLALHRQSGDQINIANALNNLGNLAADQGDHAGARALLEEALALYRQVGDQRSTAIVLNNLGSLATDLGDYVGARALYAEGLTLCWRVGHRKGVAHALEGLGGVALGQGRPRRMAELSGAVEALREALGIPLRSVAREDADRRLAAVRTALGNDAFNVAWDAGRAMTLEQAVKHALGPE